MIKPLSKNDIEKLSIIKSLLLNISCEYVTSNGEFVSYSSEFIPELDHDTSISKFCNLRYVFLKRLDTLGLISSSIMVTTLNAKHISASNIDYDIIYEGDDIKIRSYFLCEELKEILSVLDYAVINTKEYNKYIEGKLKIKLIDSKYTS